MCANIIVAFVSVAVIASGVSGSQDVASLLQKPEFASAPQPSESRPTEREPFVIGLRRESVPVYRRGKVASFKTSYSGVLRVGTPAQEFRVVFDTGSGNIVLPAAECKSEACLVPDRRRFNLTASQTGLAINSDGSVVAEGEYSDQVTIGFGTGEITGEYARDTVCFGSPVLSSEIGSASSFGEVHPEEPAAEAAEEAAAAAAAPALPVNGEVFAEEGAGENLPATEGDLSSSAASSELCVEMSVILAVEMSTQPFKTFRFDGILGLGLDGLAMSQNFSAFEMLLGTGLPQSHFGVFLTEGEDGEDSQIAFGGHDASKILEPLSWAPVAMPELGYWQVRIVAVRINGVTLDVCKDGTCRGVVDTGTSHLGIPAPADAEVAELLTTDAGDMLDCRLAEAPQVEIELEGYNMTLHPFNYMRRLPLREGVSVSSPMGVHVPPSEANASVVSPPPSTDHHPGGQQQQAPTSGEPAPANTTGEAAPVQANNNIAVEAAAVAEATPSSEGVVVAAPADGAAGSSSAGELQQAVEEEVVRRFCRPRLMPVRLPEPLGPKLFILGEPVLHRYYTVYDWANHRVGFSLANNRRNTMDPAEVTDRRGSLPKEVDMLLMQKRMTVTREGSRRFELQEESMLVQVKVRLSVRPRRAKVL